MLATVFFLSSLGLAYLAGSKPKVDNSTVMDAAKQVPAKPAAEVPRPAATAVPGSKARDVPQ
ncbi:hypothetical protein D3C83_318980 [compost metagenome]